MNYKKVAIIILNWNGLENTKICLDSLKTIQYPNFQVILIDNGSQNNEADLLKKEFKDFIYLIANKSNLGFAEGNNVGIRHALKSDLAYILLLNNDTTIEPNFLTELVNTAESNNMIGMVAPKILKMIDKKTVDNLGITLTLSGLAFNRKSEKQTLFCPSGGAALYKAEMLKKISIDNNYFDPDYFAYAEDYDLGFKALLHGFKPAYAKNSIVYHIGSASTSPMSDFSIYQTHKNLFITLLKNCPLLILLFNFIWIFITQIGIIILYSKRKKAKIIISANIAILKSLPNIIKKRWQTQKNRKISSSQLNKFIEKKIILMDYLKNALKT